MITILQLLYIMLHTDCIGYNFILLTIIHCNKYNNVIDKELKKN